MSTSISLRYVSIPVSVSIVYTAILLTITMLIVISFFFILPTTPPQLSTPPPFSSPWLLKFGRPGIYRAANTYGHSSAFRCSAPSKWSPHKLDGIVSAECLGLGGYVETSQWSDYDMRTSNVTLLCPKAAL